jgi:ribosome biogenesis GTPase
MTLHSLGWDEFFANAFQPFSLDGFVAARVALEHKHAYVLLSPAGELRAECTGKLLHHSTRRADLPAVGDWVAARLRPGEACADIHAVLPRRTKFSRTAVGDAGGEQIIATNIDTVLLVTGLDQNYNLRRIERYLAIAWESGAQPVVVLNKSDLHGDPAHAQCEVESIAIGAPVVTISATSGDGVSGLGTWLAAGRTLAVLGSSGVGKSTLINRLLGDERQLTSAISEVVGKGRHVTTRRELLIAPSGALLIDTPGMRELQLWDTGATALDATFADVTQIVARCRFSDCGHRGEPGCAVQTALDEGALAPERWQSFQKLQREQAYAARKADSRLAREEKNHWRKIHKAMRQSSRLNERD